MILYLFGGNSELYEYEFEKCCRKLMEMRIPFRSKIMNRLCNGSNENGVGWKNRCMIVNEKEYNMKLDYFKLECLEYNDERELNV